MCGGGTHPHQQTSLSLAEIIRARWTGEPRCPGGWDVSADRSSAPWPAQSKPPIAGQAAESLLSSSFPSCRFSSFPLFPCSAGNFLVGPFPDEKAWCDGAGDQDCIWVGTISHPSPQTLHFIIGLHSGDSKRCTGCLAGGPTVISRRPMEALSLTRPAHVLVQFPPWLLMQTDAASGSKASF